MPYRRDIDGLRALAIIPVIFFHAGVFFRGGFVGVDVFFVISGFLITGIVNKALEQNTFTLRDFWLRRARRILPMLLALVAVTLLVGYFLFLPLARERLASESAAALASISNFKFATMDGYFGPQSNSRTLLHTWSLAVEEQFYLFMPLALLLLHRQARNHKLLVLALAAAISIGVALFFQTSSPNHFYLLPSRAWELLLGSITAIYLQEGGRLPPSLSRWCSWVGLVMIFCSAIFLKDSATWPNLLALLPTLGAVLILLHGESDAKRVNPLLAWGPVRMVGLISYSLYLWHWPALVFSTDYLCPDPPDLRHRLAAIFAAIALAFLTWRFIEQPFRHARTIGTKKFLIAVAAGWILLMTVAGLMFTSRGFERSFVKNLPLDAVKIIEKKPFPDGFEALSVIELGGVRLGPTNVPPRCVVLGSSHGLMIGPALRKIAQDDGIPIALFTQTFTSGIFSGTNTHPTAYRADNARKRELDEIIKNQIAHWKPAVVIICGRWDVEPMKFGPPDFAWQGFTNAVNQTVNWLRLRTSKIVILTQPPVLPIEADENPRYLFKDFFRFHHRLPTYFEPTGYTEARHRAADFFQTLPGVTSLITETVFTNPSGSVRYFNNEGILYCDKDHLNELGAMELVPLLEPAIRPMP